MITFIIIFINSTTPKIEKHKTSNRVISFCMTGLLKASLTS